MTWQRQGVLVFIMAMALSSLHAAEMTERQMEQAQQVLRELADANQVIAQQDAALSAAERQARQHLLAAEVSLLEAKAWMDRGLPAEAGQAFLQSGIDLAAIDALYRDALQPRLGQAFAARLSLARGLLGGDYLTPPQSSDAEAVTSAPVEVLVEGTAVESTAVESTAVESTAADAVEAENVKQPADPAAVDDPATEASETP